MPSVSTRDLQWAVTAVFLYDAVQTIVYCVMNLTSAGGTRKMAEEQITAYTDVTPVCPWSQGGGERGGREGGREGGSALKQETLLKSDTGSQQTHRQHITLAKEIKICLCGHTVKFKASGKINKYIEAKITRAIFKCLWSIQKLGTMAVYQQAAVLNTVFIFQQRGHSHTHTHTHTHTHSGSYDLFSHQQ